MKRKLADAQHAHPHETFPAKSANLMNDKQEDFMAKGNNARKKETKKPKKDKK